DPAASVDGLFEVGSITKTLVAITALRLAEEGRIDLDAPIVGYAESVAPSPTTTLRQLLNHTSGLVDPEVEPSLESLLDLTRIYTPQELVETTLEAVGTLAPGRYRYSNSGYWLAGATLAEAGDAPLEVLIREMVLDPLGLEDTFLAWAEPVPRPLVPGYVAFTADGGELPLGTSIIPAMVTGAWSAGGVVSTASDIAALFNSLFGGTLLEPASLAELLELPDGSSYGLGIERRTADGNDAWGHNGVIAGYRSSAIHDPDTGLTVVVLSNRLRADFDTEPIASQLLATAADR
ncbi:MAG: beta-lactamase family protein, partial [Acidimicrobiia bacterium]|nr:beta-lactamase family protein [Acidimicrobiia bacterium]